MTIAQATPLKQELKSCFSPRSCVDAPQTCLSDEIKFPGKEGLSFLGTERQTNCMFTKEFQTRSEGIYAITVEKRNPLTGCDKQATEHTCGVSSKTWHCNDIVRNAENDKRHCFKPCKSGGSRIDYHTAKQIFYTKQNESQKVL